MTRKQIAARYYERHKADCLRRARQWKQRTNAYSSETTKATKRSWYARNKTRLNSSPTRATKCRANSSRYRRKHSRKVREQNRIYMRNVSRSKKTTWSQRYRDNNREGLRDRGRDHYRSNPERRASCKRNAAHRKLRLRGASTVDVKVDRFVVYSRDRGICHLCGLFADIDDFHLEHIVPLSKGGAHCYSNVAVSHPSCNRKKGNRTG
jgi:5-methylcytosine-specific restriction endonuclease McrA